MAGCCPARSMDGRDARPAGLNARGCSRRREEEARDRGAVVEDEGGRTRSTVASETQSTTRQPRGVPRGDRREAGQGDRGRGHEEAELEPWRRR
jgi:hypothetical protein